MRALKIFKKLISLYGICVLGMSICLVIILDSKKQVRELKHNYQKSINTVDSLYKQSIDPSVMWFEDQVPTEYEVMEHAVMTYDWGKELIIYFKYEDNEEL